MRLKAATGAITAQPAVFSNPLKSCSNASGWVGKIFFSLTAMLNDRRKGMLNENEIAITRGDKLSWHASRLKRNFNPVKPSWMPLIEHHVLELSQPIAWR